MLKISYADCPGLSLAILVQFALEMSGRQKLPKIHKTFILAFKVIQVHCYWCQ